MIRSLVILLTALVASACTMRSYTAEGFEVLLPGELHSPNPDDHDRKIALRTGNIVSATVNATQIKDGSTQVNLRIKPRTGVPMSLVSQSVGFAVCTGGAAGSIDFRPPVIVDGTYMFLAYLPVHDKCIRVELPAIDLNGERLSLGTIELRHITRTLRWTGV